MHDQARLESSNQIHHKPKRNLWLSLPSELRRGTLDHADHLTQYLNQHGEFYNLSQQYVQKTFSVKAWHLPNLQQLAYDFWETVFLADWPGDLKTLPFNLLKFHMYCSNSMPPKDLFLPNVKSRSMWARLQEVFNLIQSDPEFDKSQSTPDEILCGIAMTNTWHDLVEQSGVGVDDRQDVAAVYGLMDYLLYLQTRSVTIHDATWRKLTQSAGELGNLSLMHRLVARDANLSVGRALLLAAGRGHIHVARFLLERERWASDQDQINWALVALRYAATSEFELVKYICTRFADSLHQFDFDEVYINLAETGLADGLPYFEELAERLSGPMDTEVIEYAMQKAASKGKQEVIRYLFEKHPSFVTPETYGWAVANLEIDDPSEDISHDPRLAVARFMEANVPVCRETAMMITAYCNPKAIRAIHGPSCDDRCHPAAMDTAVKVDSLDAVKFLAEHCTAGCTKNAMKCAEQNGNSEMIDYLKGVSELVHDMGEGSYAKGVWDLDGDLDSDLDDLLHA
jgi:hypothetical protein